VYITEIISNFGILASGALILFLVRHRLRLSFGSPFHGVFVGLIFGILTAIVLNVPVTIAPGVSFDTRAGPAILAGFFGGPIGGVICAVIGGYVRYTAGGPIAIGSVLGFFVYGAIGAIAAHVLADEERRPGIVFFIGLALLATIAVLPLFFIDRGVSFGLGILEKAWYLLLIGNVSSVLILGLVYEEVRGYSRLYEQTRRALITSELARASADFSVWRHDLRTDALEWDDAMYRLYGVRKSAFRGHIHDWTDRLHPDDKTETLASLDTSTKKSETFQTRFRIVRPDGAVRWIQGYGQFIENDAGIAIESIGLNRDITAEVENERALERARDDAVHMSERLERFAYMASHDLQEPLRKINLFVSYLKDALDRNDADDVRMAYEVIWRSGRRARELVKDLLEFSRVRNYEMALEPVNLRDVVDDVVVEQSEVISEKWAIFDFVGTDIDIPADKKRLRMLVGNLIGNALKYSSPLRPPKIRIAVHEDETGLTLTISDNGIGFDAADSEAIFEPFRRLHGSGDFTGSGIGLAICKSVCDSHGWEISAFSKPDKGSEFFIRLPKSAGLNSATASPSAG